MSVGCGTRLKCPCTATPDSNFILDSIACAMHGQPLAAILRLCSHAASYNSPPEARRRLQIAKTINHKELDPVHISLAAALASDTSNFAAPGELDREAPVPVEAQSGSKQLTSSRHQRTWSSIIACCFPGLEDETEEVAVSMKSPASSSDEGEIVEATPLPRSEQDGVVDRAGRNRGRLSRTPDYETLPRTSRDGASLRSRSPRGLKRPRDDRDRRDQRQFRVHYESSSRDDVPRSRDHGDHPSGRGGWHRGDADRPNPTSSNSRFPEDEASRSWRRADDYRHSRDADRFYDDYPDKRSRNRSRSPRGNRERDSRDRTRGGRDMRAEQNKYSAHNERGSQRDSASRRANLEGSSDTAKKVDQNDRSVAFAEGTKPGSEVPNG